MRAHQDGVSSEIDKDADRGDEQYLVLLKQGLDERRDRQEAH